MKKILLIIGLACAAITSSHAHLGWTLQDCIDHWGRYKKIYDNNGLPTYVFKDPVSGMMITTQFQGDHIESICYLTNNAYLKKHWETILNSNYAGGWKVFDDGRGRETIATWNAADNSAYAVLVSGGNGNVRLQVSTYRYDAILRSLQHNHSEEPQRTGSETLTNISYRIENLSFQDLLNNDIDPRFLA